MTKQDALTGETQSTNYEQAEDSSSSTLFDDGETYGIPREDDPYVGLCGCLLGDPEIPDAEIPPELFCPDCLAVKRRMLR